MMSEPEGAALQKLQTIHKQLLGQLTQVSDLLFSH